MNVFSDVAEPEWRPGCSTRTPGGGCVERQPAVAEVLAGATRIGVSCETSSEKTCSVFCVTPGA